MPKRDKQHGDSVRWREFQHAHQAIGCACNENVSTSFHSRCHRSGIGEPEELFYASRPIVERHKFIENLAHQIADCLFLATSHFSVGNLVHQSEFLIASNSLRARKYPHRSRMSDYAALHIERYTESQLWAISDHPQPIPIPRVFVKSNDTDDPRTIPLTTLPRWRSSAARQGTSVNSFDFSMTANLPLASRSGRR